MRLLIHDYNCNNNYLIFEQQTKKRKKREIQRINLTRILSLAAEHGCCTLCPNVVTREGELVSLLMDFIQGMR